MTEKLSLILLFSLAAIFLGLALYPPYIKLLQRCKMGKKIRQASVTGDDAVIFAELHKHKANTPTMGGGLILIIVIIMLLASIVIHKMGYTNHSLINQEESFLLLFGFFSMGIIGLIDDIFNVWGIGRIKGLSARAKTVGMVIFAGFISYWFYNKLGVDFVYIRPLNELFELTPSISLGIFFPILTFLFIMTIVHAINITDGLDGLAGGMMAIILTTLLVPTFLSQAYITSTLIGIVIASLLAFMWYNINPAKVFMGDSGAFALGGLLSTLVLTLNMRGIHIIIPFLILFSLFIVEISSSFLQILWKKRKKKKLFSIAPFHHWLEHKGHKETTIVMKFWFIQSLVAVITLLMILYQYV